MSPRNVLADQRMFLKKVLQHRNESFGIRKAFILVRRVGFLPNHDIQVGIQKVFVIKADILDNTKPVCQDAEFKGITEMTVDVYLLDGWIGGGVGRHRAVGSFIRVERVIQSIRFFEGFQLSDDMVGIFGIFSVTQASMPEVSKRSMDAFCLSSRWQIGSVRSTR